MRGKLYMLLFMGVGLALVLLTTLYTPPSKPQAIVAPYLLADSSWALSSLERMNEAEQLAQLFMLMPDDTQSADSLWLDTLLRPSPGGLMIQHQSAQALWDWQQKAQAASRFPLIMAARGSATQADWLDLPQDARIGAIRQIDLLTEWGQALARQYRAWGYQLYVVPGQTDLYQPENRTDWVMRTRLMVTSIQDAKMLASVSEAKVYFPLENDSLRRDSLLWPYEQLAAMGTSSLWMDSSSVQRVKWNSQRRNIIGNWLAGHAGYRGLLLAQVQAEGLSLDDQLAQMVKAGTDMILLPAAQYDQARKIVSKLLRQGDLRPEELRAKVKKILLAKSWTEAPQAAFTAKLGQRPMPTRATDSIQWLNLRLAAASQSLLHNHYQRLPLHTLPARRTEVISIGPELRVMMNRMSLYAPQQFTHFDWQTGQPLPKIPARILVQANPLILVLPDMALDTLADPDFWEAIRPLREDSRLIVVQFGGLDRLKNLAHYPTLLHAYAADSLGQEACAQALYGAMVAGGQLPMTLADKLPYGLGKSNQLSRLSYMPPVAAGMSATQLAEIDSIMYEAIEAAALPGGQVLIAKSGKVVYHKAFGYHTYQERRPVLVHDLYDIASVTKIAATTMAAMKMVDEGKMQLQQRLERFFTHTKVELPLEERQDTVWLALSELETDSTGAVFTRVAQRDSGVRYDSLKQGDSLRIIRTLMRGKKRVTAPSFHVKIGDLLTHYSGLPAGLPILPYLRYRDKKVGRYGKYYQPSPTEKHNVMVAGDFYLRNDYRDSLWEAVRYTVPAPEPGYDYSDLNMILVQRAIDSLNREPIDLYLDRTFYQPLGLQQTVYMPREKVDLKRIVPTEYDGRWRGQLLRGYVHDPTAALMGGIAGNAGLFTNANDLGILFQMLLNGGTYGGERYLSPETIDLFTRTQRGHRGYGFDKPPQPVGDYIVAPSASPATYGHTGFTGTCVWVDPANELVFVFLSNRVHPSSNNWKLNELRIRQRVHEAVYAALE